MHSLFEVEWVQLDGLSCFHSACNAENENVYQTFVCICENVCECWVLKVCIDFQPVGKSENIYCQLEGDESSDAWPSFAQIVPRRQLMPLVAWRWVLACPKASSILPDPTHFVSRAVSIGKSRIINSREPTIALMAS